MNNQDKDVTQAAQSSIEPRATITKKFSFNSLPKDRAVQNLYVSTAKQTGTTTTRTIYVTQRVVDVTYLSRFTVTNESATAIFQDSMELPGFGHGETLDYLGDDYFLIGCKVETEDPPSERWSLQIGILKYAAGTSPAYTSLRRFTYLNYANKTATSMGKTIRVAAATSSDANDNLVFAIYTEDANKNRKWNFSVYPKAQLKTALMATTASAPLNMKDVKSLCKNTFTLTQSQLPNSSFQGMEVSSNIYLAGGKQHAITVPLIAKYSITGTYSTQATLPLPKYAYDGMSVYPELEGIVSQDGVFYFMSSAGGTADKQHIYTTAIF